jgi:hypothetical protein
MGKKIDFRYLDGKMYGMLTIIGDTCLSPRKLLVKCICGSEKLVSMGHLRNGKIVSCGCKKLNDIIKRNKTHGLSKHPLYKVWKGIKGRCYDCKNISYKYYGLKGIKMCKEWLEDFKSFYNWAISSGWEKRMQIDRRDYKGDYEPNNCRIVTPEYNNRNKSDNRILEFNGEKMCVSEWAKKVGISRSLISDRINKLNWSVEDSLTKKIKKNANTVFKN